VNQAQKIDIASDPKQEIVEINGVSYHYAVFEFLANPDPLKMYKFIRSETGSVTILESDESDLVKYLRSELARAEGAADELRRSRDSSVSLAASCRSQVNELRKLLPTEGED
jgi:hypothetical protein